MEVPQPSHPEMPLEERSSWPLHVLSPLTPLRQTTDHSTNRPTNRAINHQAKQAGTQVKVCVLWVGDGRGWGDLSTLSMCPKRPSSLPLLPTSGDERGASPCRRASFQSYSTSCECNLVSEKAAQLTHSAPAEGRHRPLSPPAVT